MRDPSAEPRAGVHRGLGSIAHPRAWGVALLAKAADGDVPAINSLADRTDGEVAQALIGDSEQDAGSPHDRAQDYRA